jgi:hypothetical protein
LPTVAGEGEEDEAEPVRGSPELKLWWRGGAMEVKNGDGLKSAQGRKRREKAWERVEEVRWWLGVLGGLYWGWGSVKEATTGGNQRH